MENRLTATNRDGSQSLPPHGPSTSLSPGRKGDWKIKKWTMRIQVFNESEGILQTFFQGADFLSARGHDIETGNRFYHEFRLHHDFKTEKAPRVILKYCSRRRLSSRELWILNCAAWWIFGLSLSNLVRIPRKFHYSRLLQVDFHSMCRVRIILS